MRKIIPILGSVLLLLTLVSVALAHAQISSCTPPINGTVEQAPDKLVCTTTEAMDPKSSSLSVTDASGASVDKGDSAVDLNNPDRNTISVSLDTTKIKDGVYTVKWKTLSADDGDAADGTFTFTVGMAMPVDTTPAAGTTPNAEMPAAKITIVSPEEGATLTAGPVEVGVAVEGVTLGDQYHWHVYLDGTEVSMVMEAKASTTVNLPEGKHTLKVALADATHDELATAELAVDVQPAAQATVPAAQATAPAATSEAATSVPATEAATTAVATEAATPAAATETPTAAPVTTLPTTGGSTDFAMFGLLMFAGLVLFGAGAFITVRARR